MREINTQFREKDLGKIGHIRARTYFKGAHEILQHQTSTKCLEKEFNDYIKVSAEESKVKASIETVCRTYTGADNQHSMSKFTREVLKACNVIRPNIPVLTRLPETRRKANLLIK